jgi:NDP-sugar pyrophosphorylase family protein
LESLAKSGVDEVILTVNYMADTLRHYFGDINHGMKLTYSRETKPLGTGGSIKAAEKLLKGCEEFFILNGDILSDIDYISLLEAQRRNAQQWNATATIALYAVANVTGYGVVKIDRSNKVSEFIEKPKKEDNPAHLINAGIYVATPEIFNYLDECRCLIEQRAFPQLAKEGRLYGFRHKGTWFDVGKPQDLLRANFHLAKVTAKDKPDIGTDTTIHPSAKLNPPCLLGERCSVGPKAKVGPFAVVGNDVTVGEGCRVERSVIFDGCWLDSAVAVKGALVGEGVSLGKRVKVDSQTIIGDGAVIADGVKIAKNVIICPSKEITRSVHESTRVM